jgi:hypothetical protein
MTHHDMASGDQLISGLVEMEEAHNAMAQTKQTEMNAQSYQPCECASGAAVLLLLSPTASGGEECSRHVMARSRSGIM